MTKKRLMIITHDLAIGGLQQVVVNICKTIDREQFDLSVLCLRALGEFVPEIEKLGIKVFFLPQKSHTDYFSFLKVAKILRQEKIEIIHTHNSQPFIDGTMAALLSAVKTIVHTEHGRVFPDKKRYMIAERVMAVFTYKVVGVSENTSQNLIDFIKIKPAKILTIKNGIDSTKFAQEINRAEKKKELGLRADDIVIGTMGRMVVEKGYTYLLKSMPGIIDTYKNTRLLMVGTGPLIDQLKTEARALNLDEHIIFTGNRLDIPALLAIFDIFVLSSISEGLPMVLLEAMAAKCPIVATAVGGVGTVIKNGITGSLIPARDPQLLTREILTLLGDESLKDKYRKNGYALFKDNFDARIMTQQYEKLYRRETIKQVG